MPGPGPVQPDNASIIGRMAATGGAYIVAGCRDSASESRSNGKRPVAMR